MFLNRTGWEVCTLSDLSIWKRPTICLFHGALDPQRMQQQYMYYSILLDPFWMHYPLLCNGLYTLKRLISFRSDLLNQCSFFFFFFLPWPCHVRGSHTSWAYRQGMGGCVGLRGSAGIGPVLNTAHNMGHGAHYSCRWRTKPPLH